MKKILDWIGTVFFVPAFFSILLFYHPLHMLFSQIAYRPYMWISHAMMWSINKCIYLTGSWFSLEGKKILKNLPTDRPLILVSNHQSMFDIPRIGTVFIRHHAKFISKKELAYKVPSISWNLRYGRHAIIDRGNKIQALKAIKTFGDDVEKNNFAACIFPEGTRSRDGNIKNFKTAGFIELLNAVPSALVVPLSIDGYWKLTAKKLLPIPSFIPLKLRILEPLERTNFNSPEELLQACEQNIRQSMGR